MDSTAKHRRGQAAPADLRAPPADQREALADERDRKADQREALADERDRKADQREALADKRDRQADEREKRLDELAQQIGVQAVSQVRQSRETIERSRTILSASRDRLYRNEATLRHAQASSQSGQAHADRVARGEQAFPATLRVTMRLMEAIARTERAHPWPRSDASWRKRQRATHNTPVTGHGTYTSWPEPVQPARGPSSPKDPAKSRMNQRLTPATLRFSPPACRRSQANWKMDVGADEITGPGLQVQPAASITRRPSGMVRRPVGFGYARAAAGISA